MIIENRELLAEALKPIGWEVWTWEPSELTTVPCLVIGRPTLEVIAHLYTITCPVTVIGRRQGDEDAAAELDLIADQAIELLMPHTTVTGLVPLLRSVAELAYPAYQIDCVTGEGRC